MTLAHTQVLVRLCVHHELRRGIGLAEHDGGTGGILLAEYVMVGVLHSAVELVDRRSLCVIVPFVGIANFAK